MQLRGFSLNGEASREVNFVSMCATALNFIRRPDAPSRDVHDPDDGVLDNDGQPIVVKRMAVKRDARGKLLRNNCEQPVPMCRITRDADRNLLTERGTKNYKAVYNKRRILPSGFTVPHGFRRSGT